MKRILVSLAVVGSLAAIPVSNVLWGKAHVPVNKSQLCVNGTVRTVSASVAARMQRGASQSAVCVLPACDFNNVFTVATGCAGLVDANRDGKCDLPFPRDDAGGVTLACPVGTF